MLGWSWCLCVVQFDEGGLQKNMGTRYMIVPVSGGQEEDIEVLEVYDCDMDRNNISTSVKVTQNT